jgi:topoisomerase-4 subunit A
MVGVVSVAADASLVLHAGKRHLRLKAADLELYRGDRGRKGKKLPRGFQRVERMRVE